MIFKSFLLSTFVCFNLFISNLASAQSAQSYADVQSENLRNISDLRINNKVVKFERLLSRSKWSKRILIAVGVVGVIVIVAKTFESTGSVSPTSEELTAGGERIDSKEAVEKVSLQLSQLIIDERNPKLWNLAKKSFVQGLGVAACSFAGVTLYNMLNAGFGDVSQRLKNVCGFSLRSLQALVAKKMDNNMRLFGQSLVLGNKTTPEELSFFESGIIADHAAFIDATEDLLALLEVCSRSFIDDEDDESKQLSLENKTKNMRLQVKLLVQELSKHISLWLNANNDVELQKKFLNIVNLYKQFGLATQKTIEFCFSDRD